MYLNPKKVLENGWLFTADGCPPIDSELQVQQNGIDVRVGKIYSIVGNAVHTENKAAQSLPTYYELPLSNNFYYLDPYKCYALDTMEQVSVPENAAAFIIQRSRYNRSGCIVTGSVYDSGFHGLACATLYPHIKLAIERGSRIAQIVFVDADAASLYQGQFQDQAEGLGVIKKVGRPKKIS